MTQPILFFTDNGHGLGHITRLLAIARHLPPGTPAAFLTMSEAYPAVREFGFPVEYFPSARAMRCGRPAWDHVFLDRMRESFESLQPCALVIDHVNPPVTLPDLRSAYPDVKLVWSRRGLWRDDRYEETLSLHHSFDLVIEPMDLASPIDTGPTIRFRDVHYVPPITLFSRSELLDRDEARRDLDLPLEAPAILLQLSADRAEQLRGLLQQTSRRLRELSDVHIFAPRHVLHADALEPVDGVTLRPIYPLGRHLLAFDAAVSTAGYNSFHELIMARIPSLFVARQTERVDDQARRAEAARLAGAGLTIDTLGSDRAESALRRLLDESQQARLRAACERVYPANGASEAALAIAALTDAGEGFG